MAKVSLILPLLASLPLVLGGYVAPEVASAMSAMTSAYTKYFIPTTPTTVSASASTNKVAIAAVSTSTCAYWMDEITHQGVAAFNANSSYVVYRNVMTYGAVGDGVADDTAAINAAISDGGRFSSSSGQTSSNTPAVVYFPPGTYRITSSIVDYYFTQIIGNPNCLPTILADPAFAPGAGQVGLFDGDSYGANGLGFGATNVFYRQIRNFIIDMRQIPYTTGATGVHWPTAQATSLQNLVFKMSDAPGTQHVGILSEGGSAGFMTDLIFTGGLIAMNVGNQQFTMRNLTISNAGTAINIFYDWGWTFTGVNINNCTIGLDITSGGATDQNDHAVIMIDSVISNTAIGFNTAFSMTSNPPAGGVLVLENVKVKNVTRAVLGDGGVTVVAGTSGSKTIAAYAQGHRYNPNGPTTIQKTIPANPRPSVLTTGNNNYYYTRSKPQYGNVPVAEFVSVRLTGAKGNGVADDTLAFQKALNATASSGQILFVDAGTYRVTKTLYVPPGARIVGESYSVIMSSGAFFNSIKQPRPVVQIGLPGETGVVEWSDMIVSTQGGNIGQIGAILIEWNLASPSSSPSGMWDVHTRIGGTIGSNFQGATCPTTPTSPKTSSTQIDSKCYAAYMSMYITASAAGLYLENNWFWTADHDVDNNYGGNQITIYTGRGMLVESTAGTIWLYGTAVEHHALYQYQFIGTTNIFMGQIQTETPYWQPNPNATVPFIDNPQLNDPVFPSTSFVDNGTVIPNADAWGLRAVNSTLFIYGAGLYSFFNNYSTACSNQGGGEICQSRIFGVEGTSTVYLYDLHTVGTHEIITYQGKDIALYSDNLADFTDNVAVFRTG